jgi:hypothetical protein
MEEWKDIKDYEGFYQVSNLGRVRSIDRVVERIRQVGNGPIRVKLDNRKGKIMSITISSTTGYSQLSLAKDGISKCVQVHKLVAESFISNPDNKSQVNHIDYDRSNNLVSNLEWVSCVENLRHSIPNMRYDNILNESQVIDIRLIFQQENITKAELSRRFGVHPKTIRNIINRVTWKNI